MFDICKIDRFHSILYKVCGGTHMKGEGPKKQICCRISQSSFKVLEQMSNKTRTSISSLIDRAIEKFLADKQGVIVPNIEASVSAEDIERVLPTIQAFGTNIPLDLFVELISIQRANKQ